jgi:hypothetical protein
MKPKPTHGKYTGEIEPETSYICTSDNNILMVESITRPNAIWVVNLRYTQSITKQGQTVQIVEYDFVQDIKRNKFIKL